MASAVSAECSLLFPFSNSIQFIQKNPIAFSNSIPFKPEWFIQGYTIQYIVIRLALKDETGVTVKARPSTPCHPLASVSTLV